MNHSNLDKYISTLMSDDKELAKFIKNPERSEEEHGITKAERSVLRRVVQHLPATSKSNFNARTKESYRRSLRLLQNVLHNNAMKITHSLTNKEDKDSQSSCVYYLLIYYPSEGSGDYTCKTNSDIGSSYSSYAYYPVYLDKSSATVKEVLDASGIAYKHVVDSRTGNDVVISIENYTADLTNDCYDLAKHPDANAAFWFYSLDGTAGPTTTGSGSFSTYPVKTGQTVIWQLIAPDAQYGFQHCVAPDEGTFLNLNEV